MIWNTLLSPLTILVCARLGSYGAVEGGSCRIHRRRSQRLAWALPAGRRRLDDDREQITKMGVKPRIAIRWVEVVQDRKILVVKTI